MAGALTLYKPDSLRKYLTAGHPAVKAAPEGLQLRIEQGRIEANYGQGLNFLYRYTLKMVLLDFAGDQDALFALILLWVARHQRELLQGAQSRDQVITYECDDLGGGKSDVEISLALTERVLAIPKVGGGYDLTHPPEFEEEADFQAPSLLHELYGNTELLVACEAHHPAP